VQIRRSVRQILGIDDGDVDESQQS
jgi:hypothetical protein